MTEANIPETIQPYHTQQAVMAHDINTTPLEDLNLQPTVAMVTCIDNGEEEEEEEDEGEGHREQPSSSSRQCDDMGYNNDLMSLMLRFRQVKRQMRVMMCEDFIMTWI